MNQSLFSIVSVQSLHQNELLNEFEVINRLGSPNKRKFNEVYLIRNIISNELSVLKKLDKSHQNQHLWSLLKAESTFQFTANRLPKTVLFCENELEIILILNYQKGLPLNEFWRQLKPKNQLDFIKEMIASLTPIFNELKAKNIVHCDIKPSNILVDTSEENWKFSLIDFGMALDQKHIAARKTLFALGYSAPEIILNQLQAADHTSDIFSLGITIWQLFAGKLPLMHHNPSVMTNLQITHPLPAHGSIDRTIQHILNKMCHKHSFKVPPHLMDSKEVEQLLSEAKKERYQNLEAVLSDFSSIKTKRFFSLFFKK